MARFVPNMSQVPNDSYAPLICRVGAFDVQGRKIRMLDADAPESFDVVEEEAPTIDPSLIEPHILDRNEVERTVLIQCPDDLAGAVVSIGSEVYACGICGARLRVPSL